MRTKRRPGEVRDAIVAVLADHPAGLSVTAITNALSARIGEVAPSSVRSYVRLNPPALFERTQREAYTLARTPS